MRDIINVRIGSKFIHLPNVSRELYIRLTNFLSDLTEFNSFTNYKGERITNVTAQYYWISADKSEIRLNKFLKDSLLLELYVYYPKSQIHIEEIEPQLGDDVTIRLTDSFEYKDEDQEKYVSFLAANESCTSILPAPTGAGKSLLNGTPVKTPKGWKAIDKLKVGEWVIGQDSFKTKVMGVYSNPNIKMYKITTEDGRSITACEDHLWTYQVVNDLGNLWITGNTKEMLEVQASSPIAIPLMDTPTLFREQNKTIRATSNLSEALAIREDALSKGLIASITTGNTYIISITNPPYRGKYRPLRISKIEDAGLADGTCIEVSAKDKLFVTNQYMVTHNTVSLLTSLAITGKRSIIFIKPRYKDTWFEDMAWLLPEDIEDKQIKYISGGKELAKLIELVKEGDKDKLAKIYLISAPTFQAYINNFTKPKLVKDINNNPIPSGETLLDANYHGVTPEEFFRLGGFGVKAVDEAHEELAFNSILDAHNPIAFNKYLTATLVKENGKGKVMEEKLYPKANRCAVAAPIIHVNMVGISYRLDFHLPPLKHKSPMGYSHANFESSLMRAPKRRKKYFEMITRLLKIYHGDHIKPGGYKCIIWFKTVAMIKAYKEYLKPLIGDKCKVTQYVAGSPKEDLFESDIIISTEKRCGTGTNLPLLLNVLNTISISSKGLSLQMFGRIRPIKGETPPTPNFIYMYTLDIDKQVQYFRKKAEDLKKQIKTREDRAYPERI